MEKRMRIIVAILVLVALVTTHHTTPIEAKNIDSAMDFVPQEALEYAESHYKDYIPDYHEGFVEIRGQKDELTLGKPFVILKTNASCQDEIYFFPIYENNRVVQIMGVIGATDGWSVSFTEEWVEQIESLDKSKGICNVYFDVNGNLDPVSSNNIVEFKGGISVAGNGITNKEYVRKHLFKKVDDSGFDERVVFSSDAYSRSFSTNTSSSKVCKLYHKAEQGDYPCWSGSVATIANFYMGKKYSAKGVCDIMHHYTAADIGYAQNALSRLGVRLNNLIVGPEEMSWTEVKRNIGNKGLIYVSAKKSYMEGHAVVVYGYSISAGHNYIIYWDPNGFSLTPEFKAGKTKIMVGEDAYIWSSSLSD